MHVRVVPYRPEWPLLFAQEAEKIGKAFGAELLAVHHIGSTSVEGLAAKPIIDILAVVRDVNAIDAFAPAMEALGYEAMGEFGIPAAAITGKAVKTAPTKSTPFRKRTIGTSTATWRSGITCGFIQRRHSSMAI